ncbi:MAG: hypothetical protein DMG76_30095 [Acidobacteria bacterium]|nr:MAG: hypothetical protein DMG76_30095 [Acidobacteriota bacterium]
MLNLFLPRLETCGSTKRIHIRFTRVKKVADFRLIVFTEKPETFREPAYPTTARRTTGTHNRMRENASVNRLRFRTSLESPRRKQKEEGS